MFLARSSFVLVGWLSFVFCRGLFVVRCVLLFGVCYLFVVCGVDCSRLLARCEFCVYYLLFVVGCVLLFVVRCGCLLCVVRCLLFVAGCVRLLRVVCSSLCIGLRLSCGVV